MSDANNVSEFPADVQIAPEVMTATRPFYWSVRRELWENRSIYLAPLIVAGVVLFASMIGTFMLPKRMRAAQTRPPAHSVYAPYKMAPAPIMMATLLVGLFYSLDALYGERRDRSILFWKSLPVSDVTTVISKASIPIVVLPAIGLGLSLIARLVLFLQSTVVLLGSGMSPAPFWAATRPFQEPIIMAYGLGAHALWFAPVYCWFLLVSAWAKRAPILWAVLPFLAVAAVERITFNSWHFMKMMQYRVTGAMKEAFTAQGARTGDIDAFSKLDPLRFITSAGLWSGLIFAAICLVLAVRVRRNREPI